MKLNVTLNTTDLTELVIKHLENLGITVPESAQFDYDTNGVEINFSPIQTDKPKAKRAKKEEKPVEVEEESIKTDEEIVEITETDKSTGLFGDDSGETTAEDTESLFD